MDRRTFVIGAIGSAFVPAVSAQTSPLTGRVAKDSATILAPLLKLSPDISPIKSDAVGEKSDQVKSGVNTLTPPDLEIWSFVGTSRSASMKSGATFSYFFRVRNPGPSLTTGRTRVWVEIPPGVVLNGDPNGSPFWTYAGIANGMLEFYTDNSIPTNAVFATDIAVPARITATSGTIRTRAFIDNPSDRCNADGSPPVAGTTTCPQSSNNTSVVDINVVEQPPVVPANIPTSFAVNGPSGSINLASYMQSGWSLVLMNVGDPGAANGSGPPNVSISGGTVSISVPTGYGDYDIPITLKFQNTAGSSSNFTITATNIGH